jgi:hypothetical protein
LLALWLADRASDDGTRIFPSVTTMAHKTRLTERAVQYSLAKMLARGFLQVVRRARGGRGGGTPTEYRINPEWLSRYRNGLGERNAPITKESVKSEPAMGEVGRKPLILEPSTEPSNTSDACRRISDFWRHRHGYSRALLDDRRRWMISSRLRDGHTVDDLFDAVEGCKRSPFHQGDRAAGNKSGTKHDTLDLILRDADHIDKFRSIAQDAYRSWLGTVRRGVHSEMGLRVVEVLRGLGSLDTDSVCEQEWFRACRVVLASDASSSVANPNLRTTREHVEEPNLSVTRERGRRQLQAMAERFPFLRRSGGKPVGN